MSDERKSFKVRHKNVTRRHIISYYNDFMLKDFDLSLYRCLVSLFTRRYLIQQTFIGSSFGSMLMYQSG